MARAIAGTQADGKSRIIIIAAVIFSALAAVLLFAALQNRGDGGGGSSAAVTTDVIVATRDIGANTPLTADMVEVNALSIDESLAGAYTSVEPLIGLPVRYPIQKGEQVTTAKIGLEAIRDEKDLALVLPPGKRAVAIEVSEMTSVGGLLLPGNFVDLIVVLDGGEEGLNDNKALTLLQNIEVLAVAQEAQEPVPASSDAGDGTGGIQGQRPQEVERQPGARTVTVAVTPQEAQLLALLQAQGGSGGNDVKILLALRPGGDTGTESIPELFPPIELILPRPPATP